jgi:AcrR family transcriptional regulator
MPRPKQVSDEQITTAARKVFLQMGANAPVALVAKALGVTPAALFHRTGSKERLFVMALRPADASEFKLLKVMSGGPGDAAPVRRQLIEILTRLGAHLAVVSPNLFLLHAAGILNPQRRRVDLRGNTRRHLAAWLRRAQRYGDLHCRDTAVMAEALVGPLEARHMYGYVHGLKTTVAQERHFARRLVDGLFGPPPRVPATSAVATAAPIDAIDGIDR